MAFDNAICAPEKKQRRPKIEIKDANKSFTGMGTQMLVRYKYIAVNNQCYLNEHSIDVT